MATVGDAAHARARGKAMVADRTVWLLDLGTIRVRCLRSDNQFEIQIRASASAGWYEVARARTAWGALKHVASSKLIEYKLRSLTAGGKESCK